MQARAHGNGQRVLDENGRPIGDVRFVVYESSEETPRWMVVKPGVLAGEHYVPVDGSYRTAEDDIVVPYTAQEIKSAPKASKDHVITDEVLSRLLDHYSLEAA